MAVSNNQVIIDVIMKNSEVAVKKLERIQQSMNRLGQARNLANFNADLDKLNLRLSNSGNIVDNLNNRLASTDTIINRQINLENFNRRLEAAQRLFLGVGLAALFFGMAIKNAAQNAIKSFFKTFQTATEGTLEYNQTLGRLNASFEYLKFAIADAFLQSATGQALIEKLINIFDYVSGLGPAFHGFIIGFLIVTVAAGLFLMILGQIGLALLGVVEIAKFFGVKTFSIKGGAAAVLIKFLGILLIITLIVSFAVLLVKAIEEAKKGNTDLAAGFIKVAIIVGIIAFLLSIMFLGPIGIIAVLITLVGTLVLALILGGKEFKLAFLKALRDIGNVIEAVLISPLLMIVGIINAIRSAAGMSTVDVKAKLDTSFLDSRIGELEAEVSANRAAKAEQEQETTKAKDKIFNVNIEKLITDSSSELETQLTDAAQFNQGAYVG